MKYRLTVLAMLLAIASALVIAPFSASAKPKTSSVTVPVTGTVVGGGSFSGAYTIRKFQKAPHGGLNAIATLSGTLTDAAGVAHDVSNVPVTVPVIAANSGAASSGSAALAMQPQASCTVLDLTLGPLHLNLLGLVVDLNQVVLHITAQQGGGLLGDLLCAVANLLNGGNPLGSIANLLNQILAILNGL